VLFARSRAKVLHRMTVSRRTTRACPFNAESGRVPVYAGRMHTAKNFWLLIGSAALAVGGALLIEGWSGGPDGDTALGFRICAIGIAIVAAVKFS
jgi:hypothetical protein